MRFLVIIPARYESSRFPGKPLAKIAGVEMIVRVCQQVKKTGLPFIVATDSPKIHETVVENGFISVITSNKHNSGTERIEEAYRLYGEEADVIINVQGDEPFISPNQINIITDIFKKYPDTDIATLIRPFNGDYIELENPNKVKVTVDEDDNALYFSRNIIPYLRGIEKSLWPEKFKFLLHIGIYAYKSAVLSEIVRLKKTTLEEAENLEQLRWLQNGYKIKTSLTEYENIGIDTPQDLERAEKYIACQKGKGNY